MRRRRSNHGAYRRGALRTPVPPDRQLQPACRPADDTWRAAEEAFSAYAEEGVENVLLLRLGPYAEFDLSDLLHFHRSRRQNATLIFDRNGPLDAAVVQAVRRNDAAHLIRNGLRVD